MEHKKKIWLKGILAVALFVMVFITYLSPVFAAINNDYNAGTGVSQDNVQKSINTDNPLVAPIAGFVYFIGSAVEWLLGSMTGMITGMNTMPWADMIIYNSVAMLDVNFLNADSNSMINQMGDVIRKIYFTIFSLALAFFGIAVIVMAIKLAISSIAEEKAKYKSAITNWLMAVVLLFTMHYFMAFIFYLNESVVEMASKMITTQLNETGILTMAGSKAYNNFKGLVSSKLDEANNEQKEELKKHVTEMQEFYQDFLNNSSENLQKYVTKGKDVNESLKDTAIVILQFGEACNRINSDEEFNNYMYTTDLSKLTDLNYVEKKSSLGEITSQKKFQEGISSLMEISLNANTFGILDMLLDLGGETKKKVTDAMNVIANVSLKDWYNKLQSLTPNTAEYNAVRDALFFKFNCEYNYGLNSIPVGTSADWTAITTGLGFITGVGSLVPGVYAYSALQTSISFWQDLGSKLSAKKDIPLIGQYIYYVDLAKGNDGEKVISAPVSQLASYFKYASYEVEDGQLLAGKVNPVFCFLYTIFVFQSLLYFFAYVKRFFYIIVIALMAPIVVVYDFVTKLL